MTRRTLFHWHSWIGLTAGLLLFVICWSGTIAVFSRDIDRLLDPRLSARPAAEVAWGKVYDKARTHYPGWTLTQINAPAMRGHAVESWAEDETGVVRRIYSDPATGQIIGTTSYFNVQRFFRSFHMSLFIGELPVWGIPLGYLIVGLFSLPLFASGITSLIFYRRFWRGFFRLQRDKGAKVFWSDFHKLSGLWGLWFWLVIAATGVWYLVEWKAPEGPGSPSPPALATQGDPLPIDRLIDKARRAYPDLKVRTVATWELPDGIVEVHGQDGSLLVRHRAARVWINAYNGEVLAVQRPADLSAYERWTDTADPLHFGDFGGLISKSIWFVFGLLLSGLCLTGAYLQAQRQRRRSMLNHRLPILAAYGATVGVLALSSIYGFKEAYGYGPSGAALPTVPVSSLMFIASWVVVTVAAISAWAMKVR